MEIIHQKLAWLLGAVAVSILLFRLELHKIGLGSSGLTKLKVGSLLIAAGAALGIVTRVASSSRISLFPQALSLAESLIGYVLGWGFIVWGALHWAYPHFDKKGRLLPGWGVARLKEKISSCITNGWGPNYIMGEISSDLLDVLECQAVALHQVGKDGRLQLLFQNGFTPASSKQIENPDHEKSIFSACRKKGQAIESEKPSDLGPGPTPLTEQGPVAVGMCAPVIVDGAASAVLSLFSTAKGSFDGKRSKIVASLCAALGLAVERDQHQRNHRLETRYREVLELSVRPFMCSEPLVSALVKSAKLLHSYFPFSRVDLYIHGNGRTHSLEFNLPAGGTLVINTGYFTKNRRPELHGLYLQRGAYKNVSDDIMIQEKQNRYLFPIRDGAELYGLLGITMASPAERHSCLPLLGAGLRQKILDRLKSERLEISRRLANQRFGAIQMFLEKSVAEGDLSELMKAASSLAVDLVSSSSCRVILADGKRKIFKTAAVAEARNLGWPMSISEATPVTKSALHERALVSGREIRFENEGNNRLSQEETIGLLPDGTKHGLIIPLKMGNNSVGLLTLGECRSKARSPLNGDSAIFSSCIAGLISLALTLHREKWSARAAREGVKKLTLRQKESAHLTSLEQIDLSTRSRINGPLAGILASCEYLKSRSDADPAEYNRFLEIIHRSATRIHDLTSTVGAERQ